VTSRLLLVRDAQRRLYALNKRRSIDLDNLLGYHVVHGCPIIGSDFDLHSTWSMRTNTIQRRDVTLRTSNDTTELVRVSLYNSTEVKYWCVCALKYVRSTRNIRRFTANTTIDHIFDRFRDTSMHVISFCMFVYLFI